LANFLCLDSRKGVVSKLQSKMYESNIAIQKRDYYMYRVLIEVNIA